jgi:hypothetical protein
MKNLLTRGDTLGLAVLVFAVSSLSAQEHRPALDVQTATGQTTFHIGERIPLKLTFTSPNDTQYAIAPWNNGRGSEFDFETFDVSPPTGWSDPLATYFAQDFPRTGHGWLWPPLLKSKPVELSLDLNQWVRFDQPGVYRVKVLSHRVCCGGSNIRSNWSALQSNVIELHIVPATPEWQDVTLKAILAKLDRANPSFEGGAADLRYLATPGAIEEMTSRLREGYAFIATECSMGLMGLPVAMRDVAIASMNHRIEEPDFPISPVFFRTMSLLHVSSGSTAESIRQQRQSFDAVLWQNVFSSIPRKEPLARAETVQTLLAFGRNFNTPEIESQMASLLSASFLDLDNRSQIDDLRQRWDLLRSPGFLPTLETLAKLPPRNDGSLGPYSREDLKSAAFKRWYELDPAGARSEILAQIGSAAPSLSAQALAFLTPEPLPQFESLWAEAFVRTTDQQQEEVLGSLLVKFGTGAAKSQMIVKLNEPPRPYSCMSHALALAYLARFSPDDARPLLKREIATGDTECKSSLMRFVSGHATAPVLNEVAVEALNDADPLIVLDALEYLKSYGTKADEKPIWNSYVKWTRAWSGKADLLDHPAPGLHACGEVCTGEALAYALLTNQGWLADQGLISRVLRRCVGKEMCKELKDVASSAAPPYHVTLPDTADPLGISATESYNVAQYAPTSRDLLDAKISQYPPGTSFVLLSAWPLTEDQRKLEDEVQAIFKKNGMSLEKQTN